MRRRSLLLVMMSLSATALSACAAIEPFRKVSCFEAAHISLTQAVTLAERDGSRAIGAGYRQDRELGCLENNPGVYDVTLRAGNATRVVSVDAKTGQVAERMPETAASTGLLGEGLLEKIIVPDHRAEADAAAAADLSISQAARLAERTGGKAMVAWAEMNEGRAGYRVKLVQSGKTRTEWIDGSAGRS